MPSEGQIPRNLALEPTHDGLDRAALAVKSGKLVTFPTDTFFALGANAMDAEAISRLFVAKGRPESNPVPVLLASADDVMSVASEFPPAMKALADRFWPGALTIVLPARADVPEPVTAGTGTVGVRVPAHDIARELIRLSGVPVTGTSANRSGAPPCKTAAEALAQIGGHVEHAIDAPCGADTKPSTVVSMIDGALNIIREGSIDRRTLEEALKLI